MATNGNPLVDILRQQQAAQAPPPVVGPQLVNVPAPIADAARTPTKTELAPKFVPPAAAPAVPSLVNAPPAEMDQAVADQPVKPLGAPGKLSYMPLGSAPPTPHEAEFARLTAPPVPGLEHTKASTGQTGIDQIHNPWGRIPLKILDAIGGGFFPNVAALTPGTQAHHNMLVNQAEGNLGQDQRIAANNRLQEEEPLKNAATMASTEADLAKPELARANAERAAALTQVAEDREKEMERSHEADEKERTSKNTGVLTAALRKQGLVPDETTPGQFRPMNPEEMSPVEKSVHDYKEAATELSNARADLAKATAVGKPDQVAMAKRRLDIASGNLNLRQQETAAHLYGTDTSGKALPGSTFDEDGRSVGTLNARNNAPTSAEKDAAGRATTMESLDARIRAALKDPAIASGTGPIEGRIKEAQSRYGTLPKNLATLQQDLISYGAFQAGLHPVKGIGAMRYFEDVMGGLHQDPEQLIGKLDSNLQTAKDVEKVGSRHTTPPPRNGGAVPTVGSQKEFDALPKGAVYMEDGKQYRKP